MRTWLKKNSKETRADHVVTAVGSVTAIAVLQTLLPDVLALLHLVDQLNTRPPDTVVVLGWFHENQDQVGNLMQDLPGTLPHQHKQCRGEDHCTGTRCPGDGDGDD